MAIIELKSYKDELNYRTDTLMSKAIYDIKKTELKNYMCQAGGFSGYKITPSGQRFYNSLIDMALEEVKSGSDQYYVIRPDVERAESSVKSNISFFMGMLAAEATARKRYNIIHLFHLKDSRLSVTFKKTTREIPDFFGVGNVIGQREKNSKAYLIEAKGTINEKYNRVSAARVSYAKKQLNNIDKVVNLISGKTYDGKDMEKYVICSSFEKPNKKLTYCSIDPVGKGDITLELDFYHEYRRYYQNVFSLLSDGYEIQSRNNIKYAVRNFGSFEIGMHKEIFERIEVLGDDEKDLQKKRSFCTDIQNLCEEISYHADDSVCISRDGIIYIDRG